MENDLSNKPAWWGVSLITSLILAFIFPPMWIAVLIIVTMGDFVEKLP